jgi:DNA-binding response OmpR family regulator
MATAEPPLRSSRDRPAARGTVLLVEDDELARQSLELLLTAMGYTVLAAESGDEALRLCRNDPRQIDVMIVDIVMPKQTGPQLAVRLRRERPGVQVLYVSGHGEDQLYRFGLIPNLVAFLTKPFHPAELDATLQRLIAKRQAPSGY